MKCADAFDAMLVADPAALRAEGASPLAGHLRECVRCSAAAARIGGGTAGLAMALEQRRSVQAIPIRRHRSRGAIAPAAAVAAAAMLAFAIVRQERSWRLGAGVTASSSTAGLDADSNHGARQEVTLATANDSSFGVDPMDTDPASAVDPYGVPTTSEASTGRAHAAQEAVLPVIVDSLGDHLPEGVAVTLQPGQHAAVLHTSDPKTTIVWLY